MIYDPSMIAVVLFVSFVAVVLCLSFYFARKTKSSHSYFAAGGTIHWGVNGIAFAGDYLSAASFLGICGMIATSGYDGFLYSIGYLAGWVVALFVVAEPLKRLGKFTFTDALDSRFGSKGIQLMAAISTLIVSVCYLIPQMVGAGDLVTPLLGLAHHWGVIMVGAIVIFIVATAGMTSTTYVQFIKGGLLIVCSTILVFMSCYKGVSDKPSEDYHQFKTLTAVVADGKVAGVTEPGYQFVAAMGDPEKGMVVKLRQDDVNTWWKQSATEKTVLNEALSITKTADGGVLYNGKPKADKAFYQVGHVSKVVHKGKEVQSTGPVGPFEYLETIESSTIVRFAKQAVTDGDDKVTVYYQNPTVGTKIMRPGLKFPVHNIWSRLDFISLMLALFFGTAALPHILIRYYTVPSPKDARKSTIVAIAAIGFFYILTLFMGLGAMVNGVLDVQSDNMSAPLLARSFGTVLFSIISALAFATVLGTVSGLIVAASGAVAHDMMDRFMSIKMSDRSKVMAGKIAAVCVGVIAIGLGILFKGMNVSFLVGLAFAVAASANLPSILMLIFWKGTTSKGIAASIFVGVVSAIGLIVVSPDLYEMYGYKRTEALFPFTNPGIVSIPLSFITLVVVSLLTPGSRSKNTESA
ncbi:MAG: cation acetate symporter [Phycisphaeraceae bacterium]|nr:cation acetate symporter [Phycisphaeraceae bacterium]